MNAKNDEQAHCIDEKVVVIQVTDSSLSESSLSSSAFSEMNGEAFHIHGSL